MTEDFNLLFAATRPTCAGQAIGREPRMGGGRRRHPLVAAMHACGRSECAGVFFSRTAESNNGESNRRRLTLILHQALLSEENTSPSALVKVSTMERQVMMQNDEEKEYLRANVSCAVVLERIPPVWQLDVKESTRDSLKYRRGDGEILIVNHDGRGWWDPKSTAKGDVFGLVQHLDPGLNFGAVRRVLRPLAGLRA
jgi:hypothetical protein